MRREHVLGFGGLWSLALVLGLGGCTTPSPPPGPAPRPATGYYSVGPPDELRVTILPEPEITREVVVRPDGMISIDLVGDVRAQGRTVEEIAADIQKRIAGFVRAPHVTVSLMASKSQSVTILGHVYRPSTFPLEKETRVVEALGQVAGPTEYGAASRIRVVRAREGRTGVYKVNLDAIQSGDLSTNIVLEGGDVVYVPPTTAASIGFAIRGFFFPLQQILGVGGPATGVAIGGGI